jgi:hypothetical protein
MLECILKANVQYSFSISWNDVINLFINLSFTQIKHSAKELVVETLTGFKDYS